MVELAVNGERTYAYTGGKVFDRSLPAMVFVHGAQHDHSVWALQSRYFANHGWMVLAVDLPGHGRSSGAPLPSIGAIADWIVALLDLARIDRAALIGHSMGSLAALETAARRPERVTHAALLGTAVPMPVSNALLDAARDDEPRARAMINVWSHGPRGLMGGNAAPGLWMFGVNQRLMDRAAAGVLHNDLSACNNYTNGIESAARVRCPVLIVTGGRDQMTTPRAAKALAGALKNVRQLMLDGAGHAMLAEQPDRVLDSLREFLIPG